MPVPPRAARPGLYLPVAARPKPPQARAVPSKVAECGNRQFGLFQLQKHGAKVIPRLGQPGIAPGRFLVADGHATVVTGDPGCRVRRIGDETFASTDHLVKMDTASSIRPVR